MKEPTQTLRLQGGCRAGLRQRREPRLLLLGLRPGGGAGARQDRGDAEAARARQPGRRRMVDDPRRPPRHRHVSRPRRDHGRRRHALGDRRRGEHASASSATSVADGNQRAAYKAWIRARFGPVLESLGLPGTATDADGVQGRRATLLMLLGDAADDADVQRRARELALGLPRRSLRGAAQRRGAAVLRTAAAGGDRALYDRYVAKLAEDALAARGVLPLLQRARLVPRSGARSRSTLDFAALADVRSQDASTAHRDAPRPAGVAGQRRGRSSRIALAAADREARRVPGHPRHRRARSAASVRRSAATDDPAFFAKNPVPAGGARAAAGDRAHRDVRRARPAPVAAVHPLAVSTAVRRV